MKRSARKILLTALLTLALVFTFAMVGCGKSDPIVGTYKLYQISMTYEGQTMTFNLGDQAPWGGEEVLTADSVVYEIKKDGTFSAVASQGGQTENSTGTWAKNGEAYSVTIEGQEVPVTLDGNTLTQSITMAGQTVTYVFTKA